MTTRFRLGGHSLRERCLQIPPVPDRISYARARVDVHQRLDGSLAICNQGKTLVVYYHVPVRVTLSLDNKLVHQAQLLALE